VVAAATRTPTEAFAMVDVEDGRRVLARADLVGPPLAIGDPVAVEPLEGELFAVVEPAP
jgi:hypothetical protein